MGICIFYPYYKEAVSISGLPWWLSGRVPTCQCRRCGFNPWAGKITCRRKWQPIPVFLPGKSHRQKSLAGYSPWGHKRVRHVLATLPCRHYLYPLKPPGKSPANLSTIVCRVRTDGHLQRRHGRVGLSCCLVEFCVNRLNLIKSTSLLLLKWLCFCSQRE